MDLMKKLEKIHERLECRLKRAESHPVSALGFADSQLAFIKYRMELEKASREHNEELEKKYNDRIKKIKGNCL